MQFKIYYTKINSCSFYNGSNYDFHFIINELAEEFEGQFTCPRENTKKDINCSDPIKKEIKNIVKKEKKLNIKPNLQIKIFW